LKREKWGKLLRLIFGRTTIFALSLIVQIMVLFAAFRWISNYIYLYGGFTLLSAVVVIYIINKRQNPCYQLAWVIPVSIIPVFGALFYLFVEFQRGPRRLSRRLQYQLDATASYLEQAPQVKDRLTKESCRAGHLADYVRNFGGYPVYDKTHAEYFSLGDTMYPAMLRELRQAKRYIFMEYFIIERGEMWNTILEILEEKVKAGVEVRVMYDGMLSLYQLPVRYPEELQAKGIQCKIFSPVRPVLSTYQNNRDHRKILVVDGHTAFTGGINLADEYINRKERFGHWKDTGIMLKGKAVTSFTMMFLQMWNIGSSEPELYQNYLCDPDYFHSPRLNMDGYVMPFGDSPLDDEPVGQYVYMDILNEARQYVHIMTPYLILDSDMMTALTFAAKRGIEIIIIMPHIPDKIYAYVLARSYYEELLLAGVKIYEYTPGFIHAKSFTSDNEKAVVGSINLDYRSLYLHFECAAYLYKNEAVMQAERDFQETLLMCQEITVLDCRQYPPLKRLTGRVLRLFAPLM